MLDKGSVSPVLVTSHPQTNLLLIYDMRLFTITILALLVNAVLISAAPGMTAHGYPAKVREQKEREAAEAAKKVRERLQVIEHAKVRLFWIRLASMIDISISTAILSQ
jgi:hypothetical protein